MTILSVKLLGIVLALQVLLGLVLVALVATDNLPFTDGEADGAASRSAPPAKVDRFDGRAAYDLLVEQVELGPRPAGSQASQELAARLKRLVPHGRYQAVPGGLRNVIGTVRGRERGYVVVGAHYDTKDFPGFVGANDGASGTAWCCFARTIRRPRHTIHFIFFDGEESPEAPRTVPSSGSGCGGPRWLRLVSTRRARWCCSISSASAACASRVRRTRMSGCGDSCARRPAASAPGGCSAPPRAGSSTTTSHSCARSALDRPDRLRLPCWHRACDNLSAVSERSADAVGETVYELLRGL